MRIALTLDRDADAEANDYVRALVAAGVPRSAIEVVTPSTEPGAGHESAGFDALLLGGGVDVDPARYGTAVLTDGNVEVDAERDAIDFALLQEALREKRPVLGICRGLQVINVALGGTLVQDLPIERPSPVIHQNADAPIQKTRLDHKVAIATGTRLEAIAGTRELPVNSRHHQAIARVAPGLAVSARAEDGVPEAVESSGSREGWLVAVQWHPENLAGDPASARLFEEFVAAARRAEQEVAARRAEQEVAARATRG
ncbi:MAG TPA: gamma-glutamyl-gamma-aminobutyrate hydrolase family protein [Thermoanaerobaculia bacterium]|jgi:putative glutamine amidotransferase